MNHTEHQFTEEQISDAAHAALMDRGLFTASNIAAGLFNREPHLLTIFDLAYDGLHEFALVDRPARRARNDPAVATVVNQALNEYLELLTASVSGRGRSALKSARSLFELALTMTEVATNPVLAERYMDHLSVTRALYGGLQAELHLLRGSERKSLQFQKMKARRDTSADVENAKSRWGPGFVRQWHEGNNRDRANALAFPEEDYAFYRFSSSLLHGSAGGTLGTILEVDGETVHRVGPALALVPVALCYGLRFFHRIVDTYIDHWPSEPARRLRATVKGLEKAWPYLRAAVLAEDRELWPSQPPITTLAVLGIGPHNTRMWYVHDVSTNQIARAEPPDDEDIGEQSRRAIEDLRREVAEQAPWNDPDVTLGGTGLVTVSVLGVVVTPARNAKWMPAETILVGSQRTVGSVSGR